MPEKQENAEKEVWTGYGKWSITKEKETSIVYSFYSIKYNAFNCSYTLETKGYNPKKHPSYNKALEMLSKFQREANHKNK